MKRRLAGLLSGLVAILALAATPALAKGPGGDEHLPVSGAATLSGPGLSRPLVFHWRGDCVVYCVDLQPDNAFVDLVTGAGLFGFRGDALSQEPPAGSLGPAFRVAFEVANWRGQVDHLSATLYPYGPGDLPRYITVRPWFHIPSEQRVLGIDIPGGWWPASPLLLHQLRLRGLPGRSEAVGATSSSNAPLTAGIAAFAVLLLGAAALGRPRRRRPARSPA